MWHGTLDVAGLAFDVTPPTITVQKTVVRPPKHVKRIRVRYSASAQDVVDGSVPVAGQP